MPTLGYSTPGAYYERVDAGVQPVSTVRMDVAAFVGIAQCGPLNLAVPIQSWRQFVAYFGDITGAGYLAYVVRGFFENGGRRCWIVRVGSDGTLTACGDLTAGGTPVWRIWASSPGVWGDDLSIQIQAAHRVQTVTVPSSSRPEYSTVTAVAGFERGTHVRIAMSDGKTLLRVVSTVDPETRRLYWVHPDPALRLPYDAPVVTPNANDVLLLETIEYTMLIRQLGHLIAVYDRLSLIPENLRYGPSVLHRLRIDPTDPSTWRIDASPDPVVIEELRSNVAIGGLVPLDTGAGADVVVLESGADGLAALTANDFIGEDVDPMASDEVRAAAQLGIRALELIGEVAAVAVPDIHIHPIPPPDHAPPPACVPDPCLPAPPPGAAAPPMPAVGDLPPVFSEMDVARVQNELVLHCERHADRVALLDPPFATISDGRLGVIPICDWRRRFDSKYAALYFPWIAVVDPRPQSNHETRPIPPSGHVAGFFAKSDFAVGVHKAPANGPLTWLQGVTTAVGDVAHGVLNDAGINAIRALPGRGLRILGARTVSSDPDWQYVNVRRLLIVIERALSLASQWAVFEPNSTQTRAKIHLSLTSFLLALWQQGALAGTSPQQAFFVKCAEDNNPPSARDLGRLLAEVGVAPAIPFEFVVVRIGREDNQFVISEDTAAGGAR